MEGEEERVLEEHERWRTWVMSLVVPLVESNQRAMLVDDAGGYRGVIWEKIGGVLALDKVHPAARRRWARRVCFCFSRRFSLFTVHCSSHGTHSHYSCHNGR